MQINEIRTVIQCFMIQWNNAGVSDIQNQKEENLQRKLYDYIYYCFVQFDIIIECVSCAHKAHIAAHCDNAILHSAFSIQCTKVKDMSVYGI